MTIKIDSNENIDKALDSILRASGSALKYYTVPANLDLMREAMRRIISEAYKSGERGTCEVQKNATL